MQLKTTWNEMTLPVIVDARCCWCCQLYDVEEDDKPQFVTRAIIIIQWTGARSAHRTDVRAELQQFLCDHADRPTGVWYGDVANQRTTHSPVRSKIRRYLICSWNCRRRVISSHLHRSHSTRWPLLALFDWRRSSSPCPGLLLAVRETSPYSPLTSSFQCSNCYQVTVQPPPPQIENVDNNS